MFPPSLWLVYEYNLLKLPRTSNHVEAFHQKFSRRVQLKKINILKLISHLKSEDLVNAGKIIDIFENGNLHPEHKRNKKQEAQKAKLNRILSTQREFLGDIHQYLANLATCMFLQHSYRLSKRPRVAGHYEFFQSMIHPLNITTSNPENVFYSNGISNSVENEDNENECESNEDEDGEDSSRKLDEDPDNGKPLTKDFTEFFPEETFTNHLTIEKIQNNHMSPEEPDLSETDSDDLDSNSNPYSNSSLSNFETGEAWEDIIQDE